MQPVHKPAPQPLTERARPVKSSAAAPEKEFKQTVVRIKAVGVGGGGCNAINRMVKAEIQGVDFIAVNTDIQALMMNEAPTRIQIGETVSRGLGAGGDPGRGRQAAEETLDQLIKRVCALHGVTEYELAAPSRARKLASIRTDIACEAVERRIATVSEVARRFHRSQPALSRAMNRRRARRQ